MFRKKIISFTSPLILLSIFFLCVVIYSPYMCADSYSQYNYYLKVYLNNQNIEVLRDGVLLKNIPCSTGVKPGSTLLGKFKTYFRKEKDIWIEKDGTEINYYYVTKFNDSNAFHSMIEGDHPLVEEGKKLFAERKPSSMGCIRLSKEDAKWIYNLPLETPVEVLDFNNINQMCR